MKTHVFVQVGRAAGHGARLRGSAPLASSLLPLRGAGSCPASRLRQSHWDSWIMPELSRGGRWGGLGRCARGHGDGGFCGQTWRGSCLRRGL